MRCGWFLSFHPPWGPRFWRISLSSNDYTKKTSTTSHVEIPSEIFCHPHWTRRLNCWRCWWTPTGGGHAGRDGDGLIALPKRMPSSILCGFEHQDLDSSKSYLIHDETNRNITYFDVQKNDSSCFFLPLCWMWSNCDEWPMMQKCQW